MKGDADAARETGAVRITLCLLAGALIWAGLFLFVQWYYPMGFERYDAMRAAIVDNDLNEVKRLISIGADPDGWEDYLQDPWYEFSSPVMMTTMSPPRYAIMEYLLQLGADPNIIEGEGVTPLMIAVTQNDSRTVELLLRYGAKPDLGYKSYNGESAIEHAASLNHQEVVAILRNHKAK